MAKGIRGPWGVMLGWIGLLPVCNLHLLIQTQPSVLIFSAEKVMQGEWWRLFTHPLVHVSWYHLCMDALLTTLLWLEWRVSFRGEKLIGLICCWLGSFLVAAACSPLVSQFGYCGLSGLAHGLMLLVARGWLQRSGAQQSTVARLTLAALSLSCLTGLLAKVAVEMHTGAVLLASLHPGDISIPIVEAHFGGVAGAAVYWLGALLHPQSWKHKRV